MDSKHPEPAIVDAGFTHNRRGGWWFREPSNAYTLQIVPSGLPLEHVRVATFLVPVLGERNKGYRLSMFALQPRGRRYAYHSSSVTA